MNSGNNGKLDNAEMYSKWSNECFVTYDITAPVVKITNPTNGGEVLSGKVNLTGKITEDNLDHYNLSLTPDADGTCNTETTWDFSKRVWQADGNTNDVSHELDTTTLSDGKYIVRLAARDKAGNRNPIANTGTGNSVDYKCVEINNASISATKPSCGDGKQYVKINTEYQGNIWFGDKIAPAYEWFELPISAVASSQSEGVVLTYDSDKLTVDLLKKADDSRQDFEATVEFYGAQVTELNAGRGNYNLENTDDFSKINSTTVNVDFAVTTAHDRGMISLQQVDMPCEIPRIGAEASCQENSTIFMIGDKEGSQTDNPVDEFGFTNFGVFPEPPYPLNNPAVDGDFIVGLDDNTDFPWNSNKSGNKGTDFNVTFDYAGTEQNVKLVISWSPGKTADEKKEIYLDGVLIGSVQRQGSSVSGWWNNMELFEETFTFTLVPGKHTLNFKQLSGDGTLWDYIALGLDCPVVLKPVCGDGVKDEDEECDGTDGVGEGQFCTKQCKLVPFYEQVQGECGDNETLVLVDEKILDSSKQDNEAKFSLDGGKKYLVQTAGTYTFNNRHYVKESRRYRLQADTAYETGSGWMAGSSETAVVDASKGGVHSVLGDLGRGMGVVDWDDNREVNADHVYSRVITPETNIKAKFVISDWYSDWYGSICDNQRDICFTDNIGELKVSLYECRANEVTINATKIICTDEKDLPNMSFRDKWITANTAREWVGAHKSCKIAPRWEFEWQYKESDWEQFSNGNSTNVITDDITKPIRIREVLPEGYLSFSNDNNNNVTAEIYCANDGLNYDNQDWIDSRSNLEIGGEYYCIAWNVPTNGSIQGLKYEDINGNGDFNRNDNRLNGWTVTLFDSDWGEVSSMLTGDDNTSAGDVKKGQYRFENLPMGQYYVCEESREGWLQTEPTLESGVEHNGQYCHKVIINKPGEKIGKVQFGNFEGGIIQGRKYIDHNVDGVHQKEEERLNNWHIRLYKDNDMMYDEVKTQERVFSGWWERVEGEAITGDNKGSNYQEVGEGQYRFGPLMPGDYYVCEVNQTGYRQTGPFVGAQSVNFDGALVGGGVAVPNQSGQDDEGQICWQTTIKKSGQRNTWHKFGNINYGKIIVTKWEDANANREFDNDENILSSGWGMKLRPYIDEEDESSSDEQEIIINTEENGQAIFSNLKAGTYKLSELMTEIQQEEGWEMTNVYCGNDSLDLAEDSDELEIEVEPGKTVECFVGNTLNSKMTISKTNNRDGQILKKGNEILYTIVIKGTKGLVKNAIVGDLPQEFVEYVPGSAKAVSSTRGELSNPLTHVYASPGKWSLGDIVSGEEVTLTYRAKVIDDTQMVKQKDLAWANGQDILGGSIQASSVPSSFSVDQGIINDHFVGTEIALAKQESSIREVAKAKKIEIEKKKEKKVVVLGAFDSNKILPQTGASSTAMLFLMALLVVLGGVILGINKSWNFKKVLIGIVTVGTIFIFTNTAQAETVVRIDQPAPKISSAFQLSFVAINTDNTAMTAKCFKKGPGDGDFVKFAEKVLILGGDSASCQVDNTVLNQAGRYSFKVGVNGNTSSEVSTLFNNVASPSKPKWIKKDEKNSCENKVEFKTANDGLTTHVEVYRSHKSKEIVADASTKIKTITVGANQKYKFIDNLSASGCGDDYYYGVRAFDDYGNYSNLRSEEYEVEVTKTVKKYVTVNNNSVGNNNIGNNAVNRVSNESNSDQGVVVAGENTNENVNNKTENIKQPEVKGDNTKKDKVEVLGEQSKKSFISWKNWKLWLIVTGIGIGAYWLYKAKKISSINKN